MTNDNESVSTVVLKQMGEPTPTHPLGGKRLPQVTLVLIEIFTTLFFKSQFFQGKSLGNDNEGVSTVVGEMMPTHPLGGKKVTTGNFGSFFSFFTLFFFIMYIPFCPVFLHTLGMHNYIHRGEGDVL